MSPAPRSWREFTRGPGAPVGRRGTLRLLLLASPYCRPRAVWSARLRSVSTPAVHGRVRGRWRLPPGEGETDLRQHRAAATEHGGTAPPVCFAHGYQADVHRNVPPVPHGLQTEHLEPGVRPLLDHVLERAVAGRLFDLF